MSWHSHEISYCEKKAVYINNVLNQALKFEKVSKLALVNWSYGPHILHIRIMLKNIELRTYTQNFWGAQSDKRVGSVFIRNQPFRDQSPSYNEAKYGMVNLDLSFEGRRG